MLRHGALLGGALLLAVVLPAAALLATLRVRLLGVRALLRFRPGPMQVAGVVLHFGRNGLDAHPSVVGAT